MYGAKKEPVLVKLIDNPGSSLSYVFLQGYKYVDMLIIGGGGPGGNIGGGGGASGTMLYVKNFILANLSNNIMEYLLANKTSIGDGLDTYVTIDKQEIIVSGGKKGTDGMYHSASGNSVGTGGDGGSLNEDNIVKILTPYVNNHYADIAIANNGGGAGGYYNPLRGYAYSGGGGASMSEVGTNGNDTFSGYHVFNGDGKGGYHGGGEGYTYGYYGIGYRRNDIVIPVYSVFNNGSSVYGGKGADGTGADGIMGGGGGAAGYTDGGDSSTLYDGLDGGIGGGGGGAGGKDFKSAGQGGQGGIILYYHN